jgi:hypothetical protein
VKGIYIQRIGRSEIGMERPRDTWWDIDRAERSVAGWEADGIGLRSGVIRRDKAG